LSGGTFKLKFRESEFLDELSLRFSRIGGGGDSMKYSTEDFEEAWSEFELAE
jgi:hypothetical protein